MRITWSPRARITYWRTLEFLEQNWSKRELLKFHERVLFVLELIKRSPHLYAHSKSSGVYKCVVVKQVSLFYQLKENEIELLLFWDNRQDPAKLFAS